LPRNLHVFDQQQPTLCYNYQKKAVALNLEFALMPDLSWQNRVRFVLNDLHTRGVQSVLVEGGATLLNFLLSQGWWDEARVFQAPTTFGKGLPAPRIHDQYRSAQLRVSDNALIIYRNKLETEQEIEE
jgi:diaminohydroxyphosphoribosylaminopyrimidine deaminase/5-amino-6-(5-phosphoribosylamino)uracil reductase